MNRRNPSRIFPATVLGLTLVSCSGSPSGSTVLTADMPLHLEQRLDAAIIVGSEVPADAPAVLEWRFDEPQEDWKPVVPPDPTIDPVEITQLDDALRVTLTDGTGNRFGMRQGGLVLEVPDWNYEDLAHLVVRARTSDDFGHLDTYFNRLEGTDSPPTGGSLGKFEQPGDLLPMVSDGTVQTYRLRLDFFWG